VRRCDGAKREREIACTRYINARRRYWVLEEEGKRQRGREAERKEKRG
jgi:hypothetical protein